MNNSEKILKLLLLMAFADKIYMEEEKDFFENITKIIDIIKKPSTPDFNENCNHCQFVLQQIK